MISGGLQEIDLAASSGEEYSEQGEMKGRENSWERAVASQIF